MGSARTVVIDPRFNGPPGSGNGGYACGTAAEQLSAAPAEVTLSVPPPIGVALDVVDVDGGIELQSGHAVVAQARAWDGDVEVPAPPSPDALETAAATLDLHDYDAIHPFPTCFVCGPRRAEGDGLQIFPGPFGDGQTVAWRWVPSPTTADDQGSVRSADHLGRARLPQRHGVDGRHRRHRQRRRRAGPAGGQDRAPARRRRGDGGGRLAEGPGRPEAALGLRGVDRHRRATCAHAAAATWIRLDPSQVGEAFRGG